MTIEEVLREMREMREINSNFRVTAEWASAIEAAMREPVCTVDDLQFMNLHGTELEPGTKLFTFPPSAQAELVRITEQLAERDAEIERLKALWYADVDPIETEYAEDYRSRAALTVKEGK